MSLVYMWCVLCGLMLITMDCDGQFAKFRGREQMNPVPFPTCRADNIDCLRRGLRTFFVLMDGGHVGMKAIDPFEVNSVGVTLPEDQMSILLRNANVTGARWTKLTDRRTVCYSIVKFVTSMTLWVYICSSIVIVSCLAKSTANVTCGPNEIVDSCPAKCESDYCPKSDRKSNTDCKTPNPCPKPACKCQFNNRRVTNGTCIPTEDCPPFPCTGLNEEYNSCPPLCPSDECSQATPTGQCPLLGLILIVLECNPSCRCKPNYWRNNGTCIPYDECPNIKAEEQDPVTTADNS